MANTSRCFLCDTVASVEEVPGEGGKRLDVICHGQCPRYEIAGGAIDYLPKHPAHRKQAIAAITRIAASGKFPVIRTRGIPKELRCTSREDENIEEQREGG